MSETAKYRALTRPYCYGEDGEPLTVLDVASQGDPVVPWAFQLDLPPKEFERYSSGQKPVGIQLYGHAEKLPIADESLSVVYSSHWLEDRNPREWPAIFTEWSRVLKPGGVIIILVPDHELWQYAIRELHQPPNCAHFSPEPSVGDISRVANSVGLEVIEDRRTECFSNDYSILAVLRKRR